MSTDIATLGIEVDSTPVSKAAKALTRFTKTGERASKVSESFARVAKRAAIAATALSAAVGVGLVVAMKKTIGLASDMEETQNKFNVVFRGLTDQAEDWSKTLVKSYQMSAQESKQYLSSLQDLLVPTGIARAEAGAMSSEFVKLAADLGSFNNLSTASVVRDIQSALAGGSETMTKYGIDVKVATVKQKAFEMGLLKEGETITKAARAQVLLALAYEHSSDAVGDSIRSSKSYALQMKELHAKFNDIGTYIGGKFLPIASAFLIKINDWIDANRELIELKIAVWFDKIKDSVTSLVEKAKVWYTLNKDTIALRIAEFISGAAKAFQLLGTAFAFALEHKEIVATLAAIAFVLPKIGAATPLVSAGFNGLNLAASAMGISMGTAALAVGAFVAAYKLGEWLTMREDLKGIEEASRELAATTLALDTEFAKLSERTGVQVTSMAELDAAVAAGTLRFEENLGIWVKSEPVKAQAIATTAAVTAAVNQETVATQTNTASTVQNILTTQQKTQADAESSAYTQAYTEVLNQSTVSRGAEALAHELSTEGMYGHKTAMELANEEAIQMIVTTDTLSDSQINLASATDVAASSFDSMAASIANASAASLSVGGAGGGGIDPTTNASSVGVRLGGGPKPGYHSLGSGSKSANTSNKTSNYSTVINNNFQQSLSRQDIVNIVEEQARRRARA